MAVVSVALLPLKQPTLRPCCRLNFYTVSMGKNALDDASGSQPALDTTVELLDLSWLYGISILNLAPVGELRRGKFESVQASEIVETAEFFRPFSIILTLGLRVHPGDRQGVAAYVDRLKEAGVAALGFGTGLQHAEIPSTLVEACAFAELPLFEVPRATAFALISKVVGEEHARLQAVAANEILEAAEGLNRAAWNGGVDALVGRTRTAVGADVLIGDNTGRVISSAPAKPTERALKALRLAVADNGRSRAYRTENRSMIVQRMRAMGGKYFVAVVDSPHPLPPLARSAVKHFVGLAEIVLRDPLALRSAETQLHGSALETFLEGPEASPGAARLLDRVADADGAVVPVAIAAANKAASNRALSRLDEGLNLRQNPLAHIRLAPDGFVFLSRRVVTEATADDLFGGFGERLRILSGQRQPWRKLGRDDLHALLERARSLPPGTVDEYLPRRLDWAEDAGVQLALSRRYKEALAPLADDDPALLEAVRAYLVHGCEIRAAAESLGVHRHTLKARIDRAEQRYGLPLGDPLGRAEILVLLSTSRTSR